MRRLLAASLLALSTVAVSQSPGIVTQASKLDATWQARTRAIYEKSVEIPTVSGRKQMPLQADLIAALLRDAGFAEQDIRIVLFFFPRALAWLRFAERPLARFPLGAQYCVLASRD